MIDHKYLLRSYIEKYEGSFIKFFDVLSEILDNIGDEWNEYGERSWGNVLKQSSLQIKDIAIKLTAIQSELEEKNNLKHDVVDIIEESRNTYDN